jgi:hypothetical protein
MSEPTHGRDGETHSHANSLGPGSEVQCPVCRRWVALTPRRQHLQRHSLENGDVCPASGQSPTSRRVHAKARHAGAKQIRRKILASIVTVATLIASLVAIFEYFGVEPQDTSVRRPETTQDASGRLPETTQDTSVRPSETTGSSSTRPPEPRQSVLQLRAETSGNSWYPAAGQLPREAPPAYDLSQWQRHCDAWAQWLIERKAAPFGRDLAVGVIAPSGRPVTITEVEVQVFAKKRMQGGDRIQCGYEAGGELGPVIFPDLDSPTGPIPLDVDGDGDPDGKIPGGRFVVKPGEAEWLTILAKGTKGYVYEFGFVFHIVVDGEQRIEVHGTREQPIRLAFSDDSTLARLPAFAWDPHSKRWIPWAQYFRDRTEGP